MRSTWNPTGARDNTTKLRSASADPTRTRHDTATWTTTSRLRSGCRRPVDEFPESLRLTRGDTLLARNAGSSPVISPTMTADAAVKTKGLQSVVDGAIGAVFWGEGIDETSAGLNQRAAMTPTAQAASARTTLSARRPRMSCRRRAPIAERIASSCSRVLVRAKSRLATLATATARTISARAQRATRICGAWLAMAGDGRLCRSNITTERALGA